jgi:hypothetical protein
MKNKLLRAGRLFLPFFGLMVGFAIVAFVIKPLVYAANFAISGSAIAENTGALLDFDNYNSNVRINMTNSYFSGYAFSEDLGWVDFGDEDNPDGPVTFNSGTGVLAGRAYVLETGAYIDFTNYNSQVTINLTDGTLSGYAFSEDLGWFDFTNPGVLIADYQVADNTEPITNASNIAMQSASDGHTIEEAGWNNSFAPYFTWDPGADNDGGSGLKGYCLYLGTEENADPGNHLTESGTAGLLTNSPVSTVGTDCSFIVAGTTLDLSAGDYLSSSFVNGTSYYLHIKAIDNFGNTYNDSTASFHFQFDSAAPTNVSFINPATGTFNNIEDMNFSWPTTGGSASSDVHSGVLGWQYMVNNSDVWVGSSTHPTLEIDYIPNGFEQPLHLSQERDGDHIVIGDNIITFRTVDLAGNVSPPSTYRTGSIAYGGDAPLFADGAVVTVTPATSTVNSFALSWPAATPAEGQTVANYYYMINTTPPATLSTFTSNPGTYISTTSTSVDEGKLAGVQKGSNTVNVVAVDNDNNYSSSNFISGSFTLNSTDPDPAKDLTVSDASIKSVELWRASLAWNHPDYQGTGTLTYTVQRSENGTTWTTIATTSGTAYVDTVSDSKQYFWRVGTSDTSASSIASPSYTNAVTLTPKGTFTDPAELTSGPNATEITTRKAKISWTTNRNSDSKVAFGTKSGEYFDEEPSNSSQVTDHVINLSNLSPGTTYYYKAKWTDEDGNTGESQEKRFATEPAPTVTDPQATQIGLTSAIIRYTVTGASSVKIYYGRTTEFGGVKEVATSTTENTVTTELEGLEDGSLYYYKINTLDSEGFEYEGQALTFETLPRPRITNVTLQEVGGTSQTTILVSWTTNTAMSAIVSYYPSGQPSLAQDKIEVELLSGAREMILTGFMPQQQYNLVVRGRDRLGNEAESDVFVFTTATDTRPPQISNMKIVGGTIPPVGFAAGQIKAQLVVSWDTDEPATTQVEYGEGVGTTYSQKTQEDGNLTLNHTVIISGLTPSQVYHLRAISKDSAGNEGKSIDMATIAPKSTRSALDLVIENLITVFSFLSFLRE